MNAIAVLRTADVTHQIIQLGEDTSYVITSPTFDPLDIKAKPSKTIASLSALLRGSLTDICKRGHDFADLENEERESALLAVAQAGRSLFRELMPDEKDREWFRNEMTMECASIQVMSTAVSIPWEALYLAEDLSDGVSVDEFLGYRAQLIRNPSISGKMPSAPGNAVLSDGRIGMGIIDDDQLESVGIYETAKKLNVARSGNAIKELPLGTLSPNNYLLPMKSFLASREEPKQIIHFDCHLDVGVHAGIPVIQASKVRVTDRVHVHYNDLETMPLTNGPFVFFNVCYGGTAQSVTPEGYASLLRRNGASCVVTSETKIGDEFAAMFAGAFYTSASTGKSVAGALLEARKWVLEHHGNPSALFYTMYAQRDRTLPLASVSAIARQEFFSTCGLAKAIGNPAA